MIIFTCLNHYRQYNGFLEHDISGMAFAFISVTRRKPTRM